MDMKNTFIQFFYLQRVLRFFFRAVEKSNNKPEDEQNGRFQFCTFIGSF